MFFGVDEEETNPDERATQLRAAALISGVMWHASITLVDKLFEDVGRVHAQPHGQWAEIVEDTNVLLGCQHDSGVMSHPGSRTSSQQRRWTSQTVSAVAGRRSPASRMSWH